MEVVENILPKFPHLPFARHHRLDLVQFPSNLCKAPHPQFACMLRYSWTVHWPRPGELAIKQGLFVDGDRDRPGALLGVLFGLILGIEAMTLVDQGRLDLIPLVFIEVGMPHMPPWLDTGMLKKIDGQMEAKKGSFRVVG
jgi:hypothetical protein